MVRQTSLGGRGTPIRAMGVRLHTEMGIAGEAIWTELTGGEWVGGRRYASWKGQPPIDVVDHSTKIAYQIKTISGPKSGNIAFSGAHKEVMRRLPGGGNVYFGEPEDKLIRIRAWLDSKGWEGWKIVMLYDETANRITVFSKRGVTNAGIAEMDPIATLNNDTGEWKRVPGTPDSEFPPNIPDQAMLMSTFPRIPAFLRSDISEVEARKQLIAMGIFRRPVAVRRHVRRRR